MRTAYAGIAAESKPSAPLLTAAMARAAARAWRTLGAVGRARRGLVLAAVSAGLAFGCGGARVAEPAQPSPETQALLEQADQEQRARRYDRAEAIYQRARQQAPDPASRSAAARAHGRALIFWGQYPQAAAALDEATQLTPDDAGAWHDLGMVRHTLGDLVAAERAFRRSIAAAPRDPRPRIALAAQLWGQRRHRAALHEYEALRKLDLPDAIAEQVTWAITTLQAQIAPPEPAQP